MENTVKNIIGPEQPVEETLEYWKDQATTLERILRDQSRAMEHYSKNKPPEPDEPDTVKLTTEDGCAEMSTYVISMQNWGREGWAFASAMESKLKDK